MYSALVMHPPRKKTFQELAWVLAVPFQLHREKKDQEKGKYGDQSRLTSCVGAGMGIGANFDECPKRGIIPPLPQLLKTVV
jgi:hypothetical protein